MRTHRTLALRRETLAELRAPEIAAVAGGQNGPLSRVVCLDDVRLTECDGLCASVLEPCSWGCA